MMPALGLVIFDVDGTLIDSQDFIYAAMTAAFDDIGRPAPSRAEVLAITGLSLPLALARLAPDLDADRIEAAVACYKTRYLGLRAAGGEAQAPLYPGARAAIEALHAQPEVLLGVATGKARRGLDHSFAAHGLDRYFVTRQTADGHPSKPHPSMIEAALAETGVDRSRAIMVGDTTYDMEMAAAAGIAGLGVGWGYHPAAALIGSGAVEVIADFAALVPAVARIWGDTA
ncbi:MAG: HAD-IA family hydrolase [Maritimibacter sp.]|nr:HAD-IA family hydrolase [Maritimibacter sp.]